MLSRKMNSSDSRSPNTRLCAFLLLLLALGALSLAGCGGSGSDGTPSTQQPNPEPEPELEGLTLLRAQGTQWVNASDTAVLLKGTNLGNWLLQEFWMMGQSTDAVNDQCTLEATLDERFGFDERERLMTLFRDNWITERDWDLMTDFDLNVIRLPFNYNLIEDENNPKTLRDDAWHYLDYAIDQAEAHGMYVILDLHGAVGSQGWEHHSGCAEQNWYWDGGNDQTADYYQERTVWLWEQIAARYKDRSAVAGYGLLNEPWGTDPETLADNIETLYHAVRAVDPDHVIILPGHSAGIDAYGDPADRGMTNVAFEMHFYPGLFGWGEIGYPVHRDWLRCGPTGTTGVCEWDARLTELNTPFLIGEFQPWTGLGIERGGKIARATYDTYEDYGWAATNWSYKVLTNAGGQGSGTWGMVTNQGDNSVLVKSNTWACDNWDSSFADACDTATGQLTVSGEGEREFFLVIKAGATPDGNLDVTLDDISLVNSTGSQMINNGNFGSANGWTPWTVVGTQTLDYAYAGEGPIASEAPMLRLTGGADVNGGIYQLITLQGGETYTLSGVFKDNASNNAWAEVYLVTEEPVTGVDVTGQQLPVMDFVTAPKEDIEALFTSFSIMEYDVHEGLMTWLNSEEPAPLFSLPAAPTELALKVVDDTATLTWTANSETDVTGYNVYRSTLPGTGYTLIAENVPAPSFVDNTLAESTTYYYVVTARDAEDESYNSHEVATEIVYQTIPGTLEAESYSAMFGIQTESTSDTGGGLNVGFVEVGDWFEYRVNVTATGSYLVEYRLASQDGSEGFNLLLRKADTATESIVDTQTIAATGGWQIYVTTTAEVELSAGENILRFDALGGGWNLNWIKFTAE